MTSVFPRGSDTRPDRFIGPGLNVVEKRPQNSNQDMSNPRYMVDYVHRCAYAGEKQASENQRAATQFRYPTHSRL